LTEAILFALIASVAIFASNLSEAIVGAQKMRESDLGRTASWVSGARQRCSSRWR
jgi:hypothetical protein